MSRIGKSTETDSRLVVARSWREWGIGNECDRVFFGGVMKMF